MRGETYKHASSYCLSLICRWKKKKKKKKKYN